MQKFVWGNIITRFGITQAMIFDNGRQSDIDRIRDYLKKYGDQA